MTSTPTTRDDSYYTNAINALETLLVERGLLSSEELKREMEKLGSTGPETGIQVVVHAWCDEDFQNRLLRDGKGALAELGIRMGEARLKVVPNSPHVHNLICCTLCSCYPRTILGQPPRWYTTAAYRSKAVRAPRELLSEFGVSIPDDRTVRVYDSNADTRYMVLPERPDGTEGWSASELETLLNRDSLIGTSVPKIKELS
ncbi:nitrile hydratase subunit alpha [Aquisalimonas sp. 2447]|uniref:nitrile hydratase subunit alpha n=1 Tax=Aquisalimonas sp. 2447 TaxID=2740807 RepID=UPI00143269A2|nr:nitrile hydratase subunit alpha [Aquisalimonas sp. 2447]QIT54425.1 nitrile hydratase subunit alpha [Aquisalimonas sp. 2447]